MTTDKTIEEMNTDIADFMGYIHSTDPVWDKYEMENLKYHEDWNQLHSAWEKFRALKISEVDEGFNDHYSRHLQAISIALHALPIATVHERLFKAIQWFNTTTKQKD